MNITHTKPECENLVKTTVIFRPKMVLIERSKLAMTHLKQVMIIRDQPTNFYVDFNELLWCLMVFK